MNKKRILEIIVAILLVIILILVIGYYSSSQISSTTTDYTVKPGDTCASISYDHDIPKETLIQQNNLKADCSNLIIGQNLIIPSRK